MISIVSSKAQRLLEILNRLPINYGYLSYESIQSFNQCSINTAYSDAKFILEKWESILELKLVDKGIISLNKSDSDFEYVSRLILKDEFELLLIWTIFSQPNLTTSDYSNILSCSESHFRKSISTINSRYKKFNCYIMYDDKMRTWNYGASSPLMGAQLITRIAEICEFQIPNVSEVNLNTFNQYFGITIIDNSEIIKESFSFFIKVLKYYLYLKNEDVDTSLVDICNNNIKHIVQFPEFRKELEQQLALSKQVVGHKIEVKNGDESLYTYLYYLYLRNVLFVTWIRPETGRHKTALYRLRNERPYFVDAISNFVKQIDQKFNSNLMFFIDEITIWAYINIVYIRTSNYQNIGVISDLGVDHVNVVTTFLYEHFDSIKCVDISNRIADEVDLIISNSKTVLIKNNLINRPHVILSDIITIDEISSIYSSLYDIKSKRKVYDR